MHIIVITKGKHVGNIFPLIKSGATVIGRSKQCDIRILDMMISRKHCQIESREEKYFIKDLQSTNKTYINKKPIESELELKTGDMIGMGKSELLFTTRDELGIKNVAEYEKLTLKQTMEIQLQKGSVKSDTKISD